MTTKGDAAMKAMDPALGLLQEYGVEPALTRESVAVLAAHDARSGATPTPGGAADSVARIDDQGREILAKLDHGLENELEPVEQGFDHLDKEIEDQVRVVNGREQRTAEQAEHKRKTQAEVDAIAVAKGQPFIWRRKISRRVYFVLLAVFGVADIILNATALLVIGEGDMAVWGLAFALGAALLWMAHVAGTEMREAEEHPNDPAQRRHVRWALGVEFVIVVFLAAIGYIRAEYLQVQGVAGQLLAVYGLQLIVAVAAIAAAFYYSNSYADALEEADSQLEQAEEDENAERAILSQLQGHRDALETEKFHLVVEYLRLGEAAVILTDDLKHIYAGVYRQIPQAEGRPDEFALPPTEIPGWMWEWAAWANEQTVVDRPRVGTAWHRRELPAAAA